MSKEVTAYHEAGHMCAAWDLGLSVTGATIVPNEEVGYMGMVHCPVEERVRYADWVDEGGYLYSFLVMRLAGPAAADRYTSVSIPDEAVQVALEHGDSNYNRAADFILTLAGPDPDKQKEIGERAAGRAQNLVSARWGFVEAVAHALMQHETLDEAKCRQVLEDAFRA